MAVSNQSPSGLYNPAAYDKDRMARLQADIGVGDPVATHAISARDALKIAKAINETGLKIDDPRLGLSLEQRVLVDSVASLYKNPLVRPDLERFAAKDGMFTVDNNYNAGGYHSEATNTIAVVLKLDNKFDMYKNLAHSPSGSNARHVMIHELGHDELKTDPVQGNSSFMNKFRLLSEEAWADTKRTMALKTDANPNYKPTADEVYNEFVKQMHGRTQFHLDDYKMSEGELFDGGTIDIREYAQHFGQIRGLNGNFLEGRFKSTEDFVNTMIKNDPELAAYYNTAKQRAEQRGFSIGADGGVQKFSLAELKSKGNPAHSQILESPDGKFVLRSGYLPQDGSGAPREAAVTVYRKINEGTPQEGYAQIHIGRQNEGEKVEFKDPVSNSTFRVTVTHGEGRPHLELESKAENMTRGRASMVRAGWEDGWNDVAKTNTVTARTNEAIASARAGVGKMWDNLFGGNTSPAAVASGTTAQNTARAGNISAGAEAAARAQAEAQERARIAAEAGRAGAVNGAGQNNGGQLPRVGGQQVSTVSGTGVTGGSNGGGTSTAQNQEPPEVTRGIATLQTKLGVSGESGFGAKTNMALATEIGRVQMSAEYKEIYARMYGGDPKDVTPDLMPGPATFETMKKLGYDQQMIQAMQDLKLHDASQGNDLYNVPDNALAVMASARDNPSTLMAAQATQEQTAPMAASAPRPG